MRRRFDVGLATRASRRPIERDLAAARTALAVLTGVAPGPLIPEVQSQKEAQTENSVPSYRGGPPLGLPLYLLHNRPDVRAAEADLARATAAIGVTKAKLYPALTLPGRLTVSATGIGTGNVVESLIAAVAVTLDIPLFDSGGRRATLAAAEARAQETLLVYRASLLDALADAETALAGLSAARARRAELQAAVDASTIAYNQGPAALFPGPG
jgi:multidrug efflux system outer membrane protein